MDLNKAEFVHRSVHQLQRIDEQEPTTSVFTYDTQQQGTSNGATTTNNNNLSNSSQSLNNNNMTTLNDCFELFTQCEELSDENSWMCTKCKKQTNAYKKLCISSVPPVLCIHLKRFFYKSKTTNFKLTTPIWFPVSNLDMSRYLAKTNSTSSSSRTSSIDELDSTPSNPSYIYDLFAVCNHKGQNMANGHYTAYCKNPVDTRWYCFDDSTCTPLFDTNQAASNIHNTGSGSVCTENAYILFYKRRMCLTNERWWKPYIERTLYEYDEFNTYVSNLDAIERHQHIQQTSNTQNQQNTNSRRMTSFKSFKDRILGNNSASSHQQHDLIDMNGGDNGYANPYRPMMMIPPGEVVFEASGVVNHYDEYNKPKRLLKKINSKETFTKSVDSSPVSSSSSSYNNQAVTATVVNEQRNLINLSDPIDHIKALSKEVGQMTLQRQTNSNSNDFIFKYPNDNEYIYNHHQQQQQQQRSYHSNSSDFYYIQNQQQPQTRSSTTTTTTSNPTANASKNRYQQQPSIETHI